MANRLLLISGAAAIAVTGCGDSVSHVNSPKPSSETGLRYTVHVSVSGRDSVAGSFVLSPVVAGGSATCLVPNDLSGSVGRHHVDVLIKSGVVGPTSQPLSPGAVELTIDSDTWTVGSSANTPTGTTGTLQRDPNGGGDLEFQNLALRGSPSSQPQESGSVTWSCK